ncbi:alpha/beta hydrolase family protein [Pseudomonas brassicacearum]|uniref:alpha/beta hydrolase family protein n=1 Tax=Pseudomonas brassicacearum TaxID=930166 RepID=UPI001D688DBF|nr:prolyl oligopeptidase family serine peptidase [Pseudomonas brassicacearum]CAH0157058.1 2,6-dihydropseudooxynicotine hydrolase [Pseudomonas brassicacearum]
MVEYFPTNYVWNLSVNIALATGGNTGEIDEVCRPLLAASQRTDDSGAEEFFSAWRDLGDRLYSLAQDDLAAGRKLSAGTKLARAAVYYMTGERVTHPTFEPRKAAYKKGVDCFVQHIQLSEANCRRVDIPYAGKTLAGLFVAAKNRQDGAPCVVLANGLDSFKEMIYGSGIQDALAERGISSVVIDQPGTGEALRLHGMTALIEAEVWAGAVIDYLEQRDDVDSNNIGMCAWSLGGYYSPRAAAMEKRFKLCVAWGANFNWGELQKRRLAREGDTPVPHYWDHVQWVWGKPTLREFMSFSEGITLAPVIDKITVPFLVVHGDADRQIPREYAHQQYDGAINSPKRELKFFTRHEGGIQHCSADNMTNVRDYIADWVAETFSELGVRGVRT